MKKPRKDKTNLQIRVEKIRRMSEGILKLRDNKLFIMKRRATQEIEQIIMPESMDNKYLYYTEYASIVDFPAFKGMLRRGQKMTINSIQNYEVIPWKKKHAPLLINIGWMSDAYKKIAFNK
jgi:hypothetical protein